MIQSREKLVSDARSDGRTNGWTDRQTDRQIFEEIINDLLFLQACHLDGKSVLKFSN